MMPPSEPIVTCRKTAAAHAKRRRDCDASAWLLSLAVHVAVLAALGLTVPRTPQGTGGAAGGSGGGIVLTAQFGGTSPSYLEEPATSRFTLASRAPALIEFAPSLAPASQPRQTEIALASATAPISAQPQTPAASSGSAGASPSRGPAGDGNGETHVFGVPGKGTRFVYVFDRSDSMEGARLAVAKRELIASLYALESRHQFQIIFYNEHPLAMALFRGPAAQMAPADERTKRLAEQFVHGIFADGPTRHLPALEMALQMQPDVIFFLTDANEPQMTPDELLRIRWLNRGTAINTIEFGAGPPAASYNFLGQLAAENGGQHGYVDVSRLPR